MHRPLTVRVARRRWLQLALSAGVAPAWAQPGGEPGARDRVLPGLLALSRQTVARPWFTSANWGHAAYGPWTDFLTGRLDEAAFLQACPVASDYCLRDVWQLRDDTAATRPWADRPALNWAGVHALAVRYHRSGDARFAARWLAIVADHARWERDRVQAPADALDRGDASALLASAMAWGGIFTALAILARGAARVAGLADADAPSPFEGVPAGDAGRVAAALTAALPPGRVDALLQDFAAGAAPLLARYYEGPARVPNQRVYGLEALAQLVAHFPAVPGAGSLLPPLQRALGDAVPRYSQADGGQLEQSFGYSQDVVQGFERLLALPLPPAAWQDGARRAVQGWWRMAAALATPDGGLPQQGNSSWARSGRGAPAERWGVASFAFPHSGLYVMRSGWEPQGDYLAFFHRRAARGHSMAGSNAIQLHARGRLLLALGGAADYRPTGTGTPESRRYRSEDSSWKTTTVLVDGLSQCGGDTLGLPLDDRGRPDITRVPEQPVASRWCHAPAFDLCEGHYCAGYGEPGAPRVLDVHHHRVVVYLRAWRCWLVVDALPATDAHTYTQVWKLAPPRLPGTAAGFGPDQVQVDAARGVVATVDPQPGAVNLTLTQAVTGELAFERHVASGGFGYYAHGPLSEAEPAVDVHARWTGRGPQLAVAVLWPQVGLQPAGTADLARSGATGLTGQLAARGVGTVRFAASVDAAGATLEVDLTPLSGEPLRLYLAPGRAGWQQGGRAEPMTVPAGLRWVTAPDGRLVPDYT